MGSHGCRWKALGLALAGVVTVSTAAPEPAVARGPAQSPADWSLSGRWQVGEHRANAVDATATSVVTVSDLDDRVQTYSTSGVLVSQFSIGDEVRPQGIAVGPGGALLVGDYSNGTGVHAYRPNGEEYATFAPPGVDSFHPWGIDVDSAGNAYVADPVADTVYRFDAATGAVTRIGTSGAGLGRLDNPYDVAVAPDGTILVADGNNHRVQRFAPGGAFVQSFGSAGTGPGQFTSAPRSIDVMPDGTIAVGGADDPVRIFTAAGAFVQEVRAGTEVTSLAVGPDRSIYVAALLDSPVMWGIAKLSPAGAGAATVKAPKKGVRVTKKRVALRVRCVSATPCSGTLTLTAKGRPLAKPTPYSVAGGGSAKVRVKLTTKGLKKIRKKPVTRAVATVTGGTAKVKIRR